MATKESSQTLLRYLTEIDPNHCSRKKLKKRLTTIEEQEIESEKRTLKQAKKSTAIIPSKTLRSRDSKFD